MSEDSVGSVFNERLTKNSGSGLTIALLILVLLILIIVFKT